MAVTDSTMAREPIVQYRKNAIASKSYIELAKEIEKSLKVKGWTIKKRLRQPDISEFI